MVWRELDRLLLTDNLSNGDGLWKRPRLTAATRVYGHHANMKQVSNCQVLDAEVVSLGQLLVCHNPVCCCEATKDPCWCEANVSF